MSEQSNQIRDAIAQAIGDNPVILFMKGTPQQPMCGFSARTVAALQALNAPFAAVDILPDPRIRQELSSISNWEPISIPASASMPLASWMASRITSTEPRVRLSLRASPSS